MSNSDTGSVDVLIVGAGPVGMTLALQLRRYGVNVAIVDKELKTGANTRAAVLWPRTLEILGFLGIASDWESGEGVPIRSFTITVDNTSTAVDLSHIQSPYPNPLGVGQDRTEALLDARLRASGADYRRGVEVSDIRLDASGGTVHLKDADGAESEIRADWIIGCEGSSSHVREAAGIQREGDRNAGVQIIQGDVRIGGSLTQEPGRVYLWVGNERAVLFILPIQPDGHYRVLVTLPDDGKHENPTLEQLQEIARGFVPDITLSDPIWLNRFRTQHQIAQTYRAGHAFVVGDAAHVWVPIGGQGMNIGMQDAFDLGWKLAGVVQGGLPESVLDTYTTERHPIGQGDIALTEQIFGAFIQHDSWKDTVARHVFPRLIGFGPITDKLANRFAELDIHYPVSALIVAGAGKRAPDAYVVRQDTGATIRLFELFGSGKWTILGWAVKEDDHSVVDALAHLGEFSSAEVFLVDSTPQGVESKVTVLRDLLGIARRTYGVDRSAVIVVRPDGIVGYQGAPDARALESYLVPLLRQNDTIAP